MSTIAIMTEKDEESEASDPVPIIFPESHRPYHRHTRSASLRSPLASPAFSIAASLSGSRDSDLSSVRSSVRPSRASSVVSTRTKVSVNTIAEDARSIDLVIGGQSFRIARDGSRVTTASLHDSLPPYSPLGSQFITQDDVVSLMSAGNDSLEAASTFERPLSPTASIASDATETVVEIHESDAIDDPPVSTDLNPQYRRFGIGQNSAVLQAFREQYENVPPVPPRSQRRTETSSPTLDVQSGDGLPPSQPPPQPTPTASNRRQGYWFVSILSSLIGSRNNNGSNNDTSRNRKSFRDSIDTDDSSAVSEYIRRLEDDSFPPRNNNLVDDESSVANHRSISNRLSTGTSSAEIITNPATSVGAPSPIPDSTSSFSPSPPPPLPTRPKIPRTTTTESPDAEVRNHYINMLRTIDRTHRLKLGEKDRQITALEHRLQETAQLYRQLLQSRDLTITDLETRLLTLEDSTSIMLERARNEVEDLWESRWKDRDHHMQERSRRVEGEVREQGEQAVREAVQERDVAWKVREEELLRRVKELETEKTEGQRQGSRAQ